MKNLLFIPLAILCFGFTEPVETETVQYEIFYRSHSIGMFSAQRTVSGSSERFDLRTSVTARVITKINYEFELSSDYRNNHLVDSDLKSTLNGKIRTKAALELKDSGYRNDQNETVLNSKDRIDYSSVRLYFDEPVNQHRIFAEKYQEYLKVEHLGNHKYAVVLPNGDRNYYTYVDGRITDVFMDQKLVNIKMKLVQPVNLASK